MLTALHGDIECLYCVCFLKALPLSPPIFKRHRPLSSKYSNHSSMKTLASLYLVSQKPCERSGLIVSLYEMMQVES